MVDDHLSYLITKKRIFIGEIYVLEIWQTGKEEISLK